MDLPVTQIKNRLSTIVGSLQRPEYTGENRCTPCTVLNVLLAVALSSVLALASVMVAGTVFVTALTTIYLRGYLVPGTPTLTRQYLPEFVQQWFGKPTRNGPPREGDGKMGTRISPELVLYDAGAVTECASRDDLCLTADFESSWRDAIDSFRGDESAQRRALAELLGVSTREATLGTNGGTETVFAEVNGELVGQWLSTAALVADIGAAHVFDQRYPAWNALEMADRGTVLSVLRVFLARCPACEGEVVVGETGTESCCWSQDRITVHCKACGTRLYTADGTAFKLATRD